MGVVICYICADERVDELRSEGSNCRAAKWLSRQLQVVAHSQSRINSQTRRRTGKIH